MNTKNTIEYKHLKEGDIITCEVAGYADFRVGQRCKVLKDDSGLYLSDGAGGKMYLYEMFKRFDNDPDVVYCMCKGSFIFYKEIEKEETEPYKIDKYVTLRKVTPVDFTEEELKRFYEGIEELRVQIKLDRNGDKIKVGEFWKYRPKEFQIVGVEEGEDGIESILIEDTKNSDYLQWVDMPEFLEHYSPCSPTEIIVHADAERINKSK